jgi:hypothetical protein
MGMEPVRSGLYRTEDTEELLARTLGFVTLA